MLPSINIQRKSVMHFE